MEIPFHHYTQIFLGGISVMKKLLALSLAVLMVLSLSAVAFADKNYGQATVTKNLTTKVKQTRIGGIAAVSEYGFLEKDGVVQLYAGGNVYESKSDTVAPGKTIYIPLLAPANFDGSGDPLSYEFVTDSDAVKGATPKPSYIMGKESVERMQIVYKKYEKYDQSANGMILSGKTVAGKESAYIYFVAVTMKSSTSTAKKDIGADVTIKTTSAKVKKESAPVEIEFRLDLGCAYYYDSDAKDTITGGYKIFDRDNEDGEMTFEFEEDPDSYFEVDITGQTKIIVKADVKYNATVASKYPSANLDFFNGSGTFNKIGMLYLNAEPGSYLYVLNADGTLSKSNANYDEYQECFEIKTRTLGSYVISDRELDVGASVESSAPAPSTEPEAPSAAPSSVPPATGGTGTAPKPNPGTGAAA